MVGAAACCISIAKSTRLPPVNIPKSNTALAARLGPLSRAEFDGSDYAKHCHGNGMGRAQGTHVACTVAQHPPRRAGDGIAKYFQTRSSYLFCDLCQPLHPALSRAYSVSHSQKTENRSTTGKPFRSPRVSLKGVKKLIEWDLEGNTNRMTYAEHEEKYGSYTYLEPAGAIDSMRIPEPSTFFQRLEKRLSRLGGDSSAKAWTHRIPKGHYFEWAIEADTALKEIKPKEVLSVAVRQYPEVDHIQIAAPEHVFNIKLQASAQQSKELSRILRDESIIKCFKASPRATQFMVQRLKGCYSYVLKNYVSATSLYPQMPTSKALNVKEDPESRAISFGSSLKVLPSVSSPSDRGNFSVEKQPMLHSNAYGRLELIHLAVKDLIKAESKSDQDVDLSDGVLLRKTLARFRMDRSDASPKKSEQTFFNNALATVLDQSQLKDIPPTLESSDFSPVQLMSRRRSSHASKSNKAPSPKPPKPAKPPKPSEPTELSEPSDKRTDQDDRDTIRQSFVSIKKSSSSRPIAIGSMSTTRISPVETKQSLEKLPTHENIDAMHPDAAKSKSESPSSDEDGALPGRTPSQVGIEAKTGTAEARENPALSEHAKKSCIEDAEKGRSDSSNSAHSSTSASSDTSVAVEAKSKRKDQTSKSSNSVLPIFKPEERDQFMKHGLRPFWLAGGTLNTIHKTILHGHVERRQLFIWLMKSLAESQTALARGLLRRRLFSEFKRIKRKTFPELSRYRNYFYAQRMSWLPVPSESLMDEHGPQNPFISFGEDNRDDAPFAVDLDILAPQNRGSALSRNDALSKKVRRRGTSNRRPGNNHLAKGKGGNAPSEKRAPLKITPRGEASIRRPGADHLAQRKGGSAHSEKRAQMKKTPRRGNLSRKPGNNHLAHGKGGAAQSERVAPMKKTPQRETSNRKPRNNHPAQGKEGNAKSERVASSN